MVATGVAAKRGNDHIGMDGRAPPQGVALPISVRPAAHLAGHGGTG